MARTPVWRCTLCGAGLLLGMGALTMAHAHPHIWVTYRLAVRTEQGRAVALQEQWIFDENFTSMVLGDVFAGTRPVRFSRQQVAQLQAAAFNNLKGYHYFQHVNVAGRTLPLQTVDGFDAWMQGARLVYRFSLPLTPPVPLKGAALQAGVWDDSYYISIEPENRTAATLQGDGAAQCRVRYLEDQQHPLFYGAAYPHLFQFDC